MGYMKQLDMILKSMSRSWSEYKRLQEEANAFLHGEKRLYQCDMKVQVAIEELEKEKRAIMQLAQEGVEETMPSEEVEDELGDIS